MRKVTPSQRGKLPRKTGPAAIGQRRQLGCPHGPEPLTPQALRSKAGIYIPGGASIAVSPFQETVYPDMACTLTRQVARKNRENRLDPGRRGSLPRPSHSTGSTELRISGRDLPFPPSSAAYLPNPVVGLLTCLGVTPDCRQGKSVSTPATGDGLQLQSASLRRQRGAHRKTTPAGPLS